MDSSNQESESRRDGAARSNTKSSKLPAVLNNEALFAESVRRSPRAPARVKTNFSDVFSKDAGTKKKAGESRTESCDTNEVSMVPDSFPGPVDTPDGRKVDSHCWLCHRVKPNQEPEDLSYCVKCVRVFHFQCLGGTQRFSEEGLCPECKVTSLDGTKLHDSLTHERLAKLLKYALNTMMKNAQQLTKFSYSQKQSQDLIYPVDLAKFVENIEKQHYVSTAAFLSDVKWLLHNLMILPRVNRALITNARKFVAECKAEMLDVEACPDCYAHLHSFKENWFSKLCNVNHALVWVKIKGFPYWPAKVLKVVDGIADVRFFGTHEKALVKVPGENCFWLSKESPNHKMPQHSLFKVALKELEIYIKNVHNGYGPIEYHPLETKYDPADGNICTKQVNRKREHSSNGPQSKPKKQKTASVPVKDSSAETNKQSAAKVTSSPLVLNSSKETTAVPSVKGATNPSEKHSPSKRGTVGSNKEMVNGGNSKSATATVESGTVDKMGNKNATKSSGPAVASPAVSTKRGSPCKLQSSRGTNRASSTTPGAVSKGVSVDRTRPEKEAGQPNPESGASSDSSSKNNLADENHSAPGDRTAELPPENSEVDHEDVTMSEEINNSSERPFVPEQVDLDSSSVSVEESIPSNTNTEEPAFGSSGEALNPANMLEFYEEELDNQSDFLYEPGEPTTYGYSSNNVESTHIRRPQPFSVEVPSNGNIEPLNHPQPCRHCVLIPTPEYPQEDRYICTMPLPEELNVQKYQERVYAAMRAAVEEIWHDYINSRNIQNLLFRAQQDKEDLELKYRKEAEEVAKNTNLIISTMLKKHAEALEALRRKCEKEKEEAIKELKKKLLCNQCGKEAKFLCCGDNSCCDHPCRKAHSTVDQNTSSSPAHVNSSSEPQLPDTIVSNTHNTQKTSKEQSRASHTGVVSAKQKVRPSHSTSSSSQKAPTTTVNSATSVAPSPVAQSRTSSALMSKKGQTHSSSQHTTSCHRFSRTPVVPLPPLTPRPPEAIVSRSTSVPPESPAFV